MKSKISIDLHKLSRFVNLFLPILAIIFFLAGLKLSFYYHFLTVSFLFATALNVFYLYLQNGHALLRNFGLLAQGRYMLESVGPELRQYLYASDTEEKPFNRLERAEVYRKSQNIDSASSFGSLHTFDATELKIRHSLFPTPTSELTPYSLTFGEERGIENTHTIRKPYIISAMSYGALGKNAVRALARGAKLADITMNTGEGGYPKYHLMEGCDLIFQLGTAKFGVRNKDGTLNEEKLKEIADKPTIKMIEIKLSQGAKPGKGGLLPKEKISDEIAELRGVSKEHDVVSPAFHSECKDYTSLTQFIKRVQNIANIPVGIKLCIGDLAQFENMIQEFKKQDIFPDWITIDGSEGGTGAAPRAFIDRVGMPLLPALKGANDALNEAGVRNRLKLLASGKLIGPGRQMLAFCLGADAICSARGFMLSLGCIQAIQCGSNACPVGITTHDPKLEHGLDISIKAARVRNYVNNLKHDIDELVAATGCQSINDLSFKHLYVPADSSISPHVPNN
ncbi:FMN-binding glutamate synthase family protein [Puniceicoccaceae bacterium K14]|nr:FMN-binding glutamate synthase family protein [Puniceicoccaceae bacterium K14]